ncbi:DEAD/DEAH box helicase [Subtercola sp. YIM 133946]|uniref:DEAD/DEAH box helicase n=1 Tax=Subtercola sp. YIM 133946 TaxID=3118909 RepID=UPI002F923639
MSSDAYPLVDVADIVRLVGRAAFERGREYSRDDDVRDVLWNSESLLLEGVVQGSGAQPYHCRITLTERGGRMRVETDAYCSCPVSLNCKHVAATLLAGNARHLLDDEVDGLTPARDVVAPWRDVSGAGRASAAPGTDDAHVGGDGGSRSGQGVGAVPPVARAQAPVRRFDSRFEPRDALPRIPRVGAAGVDDRAGGGAGGEGDGGRDGLHGPGGGARGTGDTRRNAAGREGDGAEGRGGRVAGEGVEAWYPPAPRRPEPTKPLDWRAAVGGLVEQAGHSEGGSERASGGGIGSRGSSAAPTPMGLQFEVREFVPRTREQWRGPLSQTAKPRPDEGARGAGRSADAGTGGDGARGAGIGADNPPRRLGVRPVVRNHAGTFVKANVSWPSFAHQVNRLNLDPAHLRWFAQFAALHRATKELYSGQETDWLYLDDFASPLLWNLLDEAEELGIPLRGSKKSTVVRLASRARVRLEATREASGGVAAGQGSGFEGGLVLTPVVTIDGVDHQAGAAGAIGDHGVYAYELGASGLITFGRLEAAAVDGVDKGVDNGVETPPRLTAEVRALLESAAPVAVPAQEVGEFFERYYAPLTRAIDVVAADETVQLPAVVVPVLVVACRFRPKNVLQLEWLWEYGGAQPVRFALGGVEGDDGRGGDGVTGSGAVQGPGRATVADESDRARGANGFGGADGAGGTGAGPYFADRDVVAERRIRAAALRVLQGFVDETTVDADVEAMTGLVLQGYEAAVFTDKVLPALELTPGVRLESTGKRPEYRELTGEPELTVTTVESEKRDWFDLGVVINLNGYRIPFAPLLKALTRKQKKLLMVDKTYLTLDHPVFERLRELLEEASNLDEWQTGVRISRYQTELWSDFEDLAEETVQAVAWREAVAGLRELRELEGVAGGAEGGVADGDASGDVEASGEVEASADVQASANGDAGAGGGREGGGPLRSRGSLGADIPVPEGVDATLRPYQLDGYRWLAFLYRYGLGGVLADDMGLGKTLQTLALVEHAREAQRAGGGTSGAGGAGSPGEASSARAASGAPFLVVAPTSVVGNWVLEAQRFTPGLVVRSVTATQAKASTTLAELAAGADVVVTSYTLFRLDADAYQKLDWSGLILDEAQFVKNHTSKLHRCAKDFDAPFKLAITGTPLENNLMELWALFDIVAPGLFASSRKFTETFVRPVERGHDAEVLPTLRRRIRPFLLRRTKELVAPELPAKQEQVLNIALTPSHRAVYDTYFQRERQKLLGLIEDLDRNRLIVFRSLTLLRLLSLDASLIDAKYEGIPSAKLDALVEQLDDVVVEGHRALVFSQFTSFLSRAATRLDAAGISYEYLDGSTRRRPEVIERFKTGTASVFLISLKAGGFGLNLTEADYVFLLDPWWNPATESQAVDRTHRIGQKSSVNVYRMVAQDTIEEKVMALKEQKARLFDAVLDDDAAFSTALSADDIRGLLDD